jgi:hypothetical protein
MKQEKTFLRGILTGDAPTARSKDAHSFFWHRTNRGTEIV